MGVQRHRYIAIDWLAGALPLPRVAAIEDALDVELLLQPVPLEDVAAAVQRAAEQFPA
jgi:hypothetical protein